MPVWQVAVSPVKVVERSKLLRLKEGVIMTPSHSKGLPLALLLGFLTVPMLSPAADSGDDTHASHHQETGTASTTTCPAAHDMNQMMEQMQSMHQQVAAAKTPAQRRSLMDAHMKAMQSGMAMMDQMASPACSSAMGGSDMMQKRMDMMTMMMQMMMDHHQMMGGMRMMGGMDMGNGMSKGKTTKQPKKPEN
jgi:hypothetical protein